MTYYLKAKDIFVQRRTADGKFEEYGLIVSPNSFIMCDSCNNLVAVPSTTITLATASYLESNCDIYVNGITVGRGLGDNPSNTVFGYEAFANNVIGINNLAVGQYTLFNNTVGEDNVALGANALYSIDGYGNIGVGSNTLYNAVFSDYNVAIGLNALTNLNVDSSSLNTAIGYNTGTGLAYGFQNIFIGANAGSSAVFDGANNICLIGGDSGSSDAVNVGIGVTSLPSNALHINAIDPLRLEGLTSISTGTILVADTDGTIYMSNNGGSTIITGSTYPITSSWANTASYAITSSYAPTNITYASASLQTTVTMSTANIWYDGPSITLGSGTWLVESQGQFRRTSTGTTNTLLRINNGNIVYAQVHQFQSSVNPNAYAMKLGAIINLTAVQSAITASALIDSNTVYFSNRTDIYPSGSVATQIYAIKIL